MSEKMSDKTNKLSETPVVKECFSNIKEVKAVYSDDYYCYESSNDVCLICKKCGTPWSVVLKYQNRRVECKGCIRQKENPLHKGSYKRNCINDVHNWLRVMRQYQTDEGFLCDVQCLECKNYLNGVHHYDLKNSKIKCFCEGKITRYKCDKCVNSILLNIQEIQKIEEMQGQPEIIICKTCGNKRTPLIKTSTTKFDDYKMSINIKTNELQKKYGIDSLGHVAGFDLQAYRIEPKIKTIDGLSYYRYACLQCNVEIVSSSAHIEGDLYNHEKCGKSGKPLFNYEEDCI